MAQFPQQFSAKFDGNGGEDAPHASRLEMMMEQAKEEERSQMMQISMPFGNHVEQLYCLFFHSTVVVSQAFTRRAVLLDDNCSL